MFGNGDIMIISYVMIRITAQQLHTYTRILQTGEGMSIIMIELPIRYTLFLTQCGILHDVYHTTSCEESTSVKDY